MTTIAIADSATTTQQSQNGSASSAAVESAPKAAPDKGASQKSEVDTWVEALQWVIAAVTPSWVSEGRTKESSETGVRLRSKHYLAEGILNIIAPTSLRLWREQAASLQRLSAECQGVSDERRRADLERAVVALTRSTEERFHLIAWRAYALLDDLSAERELSRWGQSSEADYYLSGAATSVLVHQFKEKK